MKRKQYNRLMDIIISIIIICLISLVISTCASCTSTVYCHSNQNNNWKKLDFKTIARQSSKRTDDRLNSEINQLQKLYRYD
jgi:LEA14-like dessication related protein